MTQLLRAQISRALLFAFAVIFLAQAKAQQPADAATNWQPQLHFSAPPNWINDPNGPIFLNGQYHLFFSSIPSATCGDT